jgi:hypothetical protein
MTCTTCGKEITNSPTYISGECQFPLTHSHPTIDNVKLPGRAAKIFNRMDSESRVYPAGLTLQERGTLQNTRIYHNDFSTELECSIWQN